MTELQTPLMQNKFRVRFQSDDIEQLTIQVFKCVLDYAQGTATITLRHPLGSVDFTNAIKRVLNDKSSIYIDYLGTDGVLRFTEAFRYTATDHVFELNYASEEPAVHKITFRSKL